MLAEGQVVTEHHEPRILSVGVRFLYVELTDLEALARSEAAPGPVTRISAARGLDGVFAYTRIANGSENGFDIRARVYAPVHGVIEDPASGSANAGLANILASMNGEADATLEWNVAQGVEMGRPSRLHVTAERRKGEVAEIRVAGGVRMRKCSAGGVMRSRFWASAKNSSLSSGRSLAMRCQAALRLA